MEARGPEDHGDEHDDGGDPADDEEGVAPDYGDADLLGQVVELVDALGDGHGDEDAGDDEHDGGEQGEEEVPDGDEPVIGQEERGDAEDGREAAEAYAQDVEDEEAEEDLVDDVELVLHLLVPAQVGDVDVKGADAEFLVHQCGHVEVDWIFVSDKLHERERKRDRFHIHPASEAVQLVMLSDALETVEFGE